MIAKSLASSPRIILLDEPTRGVDVGAKAEIYALIRDITEQGKAVILLGDTTDEYLGLSSRLIVMKDGIVTGEFDAIDEMPSQVEVVSYRM